MQTSGSLPADDTNLSTPFTEQNYTDVADDDEQFVCQPTVSPNYAIFLFKGKYSAQSNCTVTWEGKAGIAPSLKKVVLQVWDRDGNTWEDLDEENSVGVDTEFTLTGTISSDFDHYYDASFYIAFRVYQGTV